MCCKFWKVGSIQQVEYTPPRPSQVNSRKKSCSSTNQALLEVQGNEFPSSYENQHLNRYFFHSIQFYISWFQLVITKYGKIESDIIT